MKKIILTMAVVLTAIFANAQSNQQGTIHVNVMGGFLSGSATSQYDASGSPKNDYSATGGQFAGNFQYGLTEDISAGIGLEFGSAVLTPNDFNSLYTSNNLFNDTTISTFKIILSGRYYFLNKEKFNLFAGPSFGYTSGTASVLNLGGDKDYSGLNYGINAGGNYYFTDHVGVIFNLGYEANSLKSTESGTSSDISFNFQDFEESTSTPDKTGKTSLSGIKFMFGLALKF